MIDNSLRRQFNQIEEELTHAENARARGNEGMARVCSRRAAGIAIGIYLYRNGFSGFGASAFERLNILQTLTNTSPQVVEIAEHLLLQVNKDHMLPSEIDLIEDTRRLINYLIPEMGPENS